MDKNDRIRVLDDVFDLPIQAAKARRPKLQYYGCGGKKRRKESDRNRLCISNGQ